MAEHQQVSRNKARHTPGTEQKQYTEADAIGSLVRAAKLVVIFAAVALPVAWWRGGWASAALLLVGAAISASGLWEWRRLMAALMARMEQGEADMQQAPPSSAGQSSFGQSASSLDAAELSPSLTEEGLAGEVKRPSIGFAIAGFVVRMILVLAVLYVSLRCLHGSVLALAAGLAMGVVALTVEGLRLLRSGTI